MKHNIYEMIRENREEAISILSTLPNKELRLVENLNWDSIEEDGIISDDDIKNEELRDLPCVVVADDTLTEVLVIKILLSAGSVNFYGVRVGAYGNYLESEIGVYHISDCVDYYENVLYEAVDDYTNLKK